MNGRTRGDQTRKNQTDGGIRPVIDVLRDKKLQCLADLSLEQITRPNGLTEQVAKNLQGKVNTAQLRKFFNEVKRATQLAKKGKLDEARTTLLKVYPMIAYASSPKRKLIPRELAELLTVVVEKTEGCNDSEKVERSFERLDDFMTALYAYFKKYER